MSVGDLKNNLRKLQAELKSIKYEKDVDVESLSRGAAGSFLPIYHYLLLDYSHAVSENVANLNIELAGKTDLRFVESLYKVLRELFTYKPPITKEQFFSNGFAERKVIMCTEIIRLVKVKNKSLMPRTAKKAPGSATAQTAKLGPRPASGSQSLKPQRESNQTNTLVPSTDAAKLPPRPPARPSSSSVDGVPVQVVNEIRKAVQFSIPELHSSEGCPVHEEKVSLLIQSTDSPVTPFNVETETVAVGRRVVREEAKVVPVGPQPGPWEGMKAVIVTSGDQSVDETGSYNPARYSAVQDDQDSADEASQYQRPQTTLAVNHPRPIDIIAMTPAKPPQPKRDNSSSVAESSLSADRLESTMHTLQQTVHDLSSRMINIENRLGVIEGFLSAQQQQKAAETDRVESVLSPQQLETILARVTLVENQVSLVQAQQKSTISPRTAKDTPSEKSFQQVNGHASPQHQYQVQQGHPAQNSAWTFTPIQHPISKVSSLQHKEDFGTASPALSEVPGSPLEAVGQQTAVNSFQRSSSTPTDLAVTVNHLPENVLKDLTQSQADRISNMLKTTETLLNLQVESPKRPLTDYTI